MGNRGRGWNNLKIIKEIKKGLKKKRTENRWNT